MRYLIDFIKCYFYLRQDINNPQNKIENFIILNSGFYKQYNKILPKVLKKKHLAFGNFKEMYAYTPSNFKQANEPYLYIFNSYGDYLNYQDKLYCYQITNKRISDFL